MVFDHATLRERRVAAGFTQEQLAQEIGVRLRTVTRWEAGTNAPNNVQLLTLAAALRVSPEQLYVDRAPAA